MLDEIVDRELTEDEWNEVKRQVFRGITKLQGLARENKLKASGALHGKVTMNSIKWDEIETKLSTLGHLTKTKFDEVQTIQATQASSESLPVWAACVMTGLVFTLIFTVIIAVGLYRMQARKMKRAALGVSMDMNTSHAPEPVT